MGEPVAAEVLTMPLRAVAKRLSGAQKEEARTIALGLVRDPVYREKLRIDWQRRRLNPLVEQMVWHYAFGKPPDRIELGHPGDFDDLQDLSDDQLAQRAEAVAQVLKLPATERQAALDEAAQEATEDVDAVLERREERKAQIREAVQSVDAAREDRAMQRLRQEEEKRQRVQERIDALKGADPKKLTPRQIGELLEAEGLLNEDENVDGS